jgi:2-dehydro-3-deoxygluconokinase
VSRLVALGETMVLLDAPARLRRARALDVGIGGAESNVAMTAASLGTPSAWLGRVGDDELGELILRRLRADGVDARAAVKDPGAPTSLMVKERDPRGTTRVRYYRTGGPGSRLQPDDVDAALVEQAAVLHVTGITPALSDSARATVHHAIDVAEAAGVIVSLDFNYRSALWPPETAGPELRRLAARAGVVFAGEAEAAIAVGDHPAEELARRLAALGPEQVVIKRGDRGAVARVAGETLHAPATPAVVVDPVGAGDAFVAGYLHALLAGAEPAARLALANACGAFAVGRHGDCDVLPNLVDLTTEAVVDVLR